MNIPRAIVLSVVVFFAACVDGGTPSDAGSDAGPACPALTGVEVNHQDDITTAVTWPGDGTVHRVLYDFTIRPGGSLTLSPCAVVKLPNNRVITLNGSPTQPAKLISAGTENQPVLITNAIDGGHWGALLGMGPTSTFDFSYTTLENGGGTSPGFSLDVRGNGAGQSAAVPVVRANHLTIKGSLMGTSLVLESGAAFTADSTELTITGGGGGATVNNNSALQLGPIAAGTLPKLNLSGNARDQIQINAGYISRDVTLKDLGAPYYFYFDRVRVTDQTGASTPTLTLEPGVELRFDDYLAVGFDNPGISSAPGKLIAVGTATRPIVFTSSKVTRAAGDWPGIWLANAAGSRLENVRIEYAGGANSVSSSNCKPAGSTDNAALFIGFPGYAYVPAASDFVSVQIEASASHGINSMWMLPSDLGPNLTAGFTFGALNGCKQTRNRSTTACTVPLACMVP